MAIQAGVGKLRIKPLFKKFEEDVIVHDSTIKTKKVELLEKENRINELEKEAKDRSKKSAKDLRRISFDLMPPVFEKIGLVDSIDELVRRNQTENTRIHFFENGKKKSIEIRKALNIYRIISELLQNALKHAAASNVIINISYLQDGTVFMVEDNGHGFTQTSKRGLGLNNIFKRVEYIDGILTYDTSSKGTTFVLSLKNKS